MTAKEMLNGGWKPIAGGFLAVALGFGGNEAFHRNTASAQPASAASVAEVKKDCADPEKHPNTSEVRVLCDKQIASSSKIELVVEAANRNGAKLEKMDGKLDTILERLPR